jgi:hypothetical protein
MGRDESNPVVQGRVRSKQDPRALRKNLSFANFPSAHRRGVDGPDGKGARVSGGGSGLGGQRWDAAHRVETGDRAIVARRPESARRARCRRPCRYARTMRLRATRADATARRCVAKRSPLLAPTASAAQVPGKDSRSPTPTRHSAWRSTAAARAATCSLRMPCHGKLCSADRRADAIGNRSQRSSEVALFRVVRGRGDTS